MTIENEVFKKVDIDISKLAEYGFKKKSDVYIYEQLFKDGEFKAIITINSKGEISGKVFDVENNDEYLPLRVEYNQSAYAGVVKSAYIEILEDIRKECSSPKYFIYPQSNRIANLIKEKYGNEPEFLWEKFQGSGVFRNPETKKWYLAILDVDRSKLQAGKKGLVEVADIKLEPEKIQKLIMQDGFYPAYHMSKKSWITIILDETLSDETIMEYIDKSHELTAGKKKSKNGVYEWIIPCNPKYFDIDKAFEENKEILWKQSTDIKVGDIVYMYLASPYSEIRYKCKVTEANIPYEYEDKNLKINKVMKIKLLKKYPENKFSFKLLKEQGLKTVRGPQILSEKLSKFLKQN